MARSRKPKPTPLLPGVPIEEQVAPKARAARKAGPPAKRPNVRIDYGGVVVRQNDEGFYSLNDMWKADGSTPNRDPRQWIRKEGSGFIADLGSNLNVPVGHIIKAGRGKGLTSGTWAHWQIAVAYASYLSHPFHRYVNEAFREWLEEKQDPGLKMERSVAAMEKMGRARTWIAERFDGILVRNELTATMADHNCKKLSRVDNPYAEGTRTIYLKLLGKTAREIRAERGLVSKAQKTRDHMEEFELARVKFAESEATHLMKRRAADGNAECVDCCRVAGDCVRRCIDDLDRRALPG